MKKARIVITLAPTAPPCFSSRDQWLEYLVSCAADQRARHAAGPVIEPRGKPAQFNYAFAFCADCRAQHAYAMTVAGRCDKDWLKRLDPKK